MEEIGRRLRSVRESKGITLAAAEEVTKIRQKYLEALEAGLSKELPGEVYLKGFLRSYGNYLGLDGDALVEQYKESKGSWRVVGRAAAAEEAAPREPASPEPASPEPAPSQRRSAAAGSAARSRPTAGRSRLTVSLGPGSRNSLVTGLLLVASVAVVGYLGWLIAGQFNTEAPRTSEPGTPGAPAAQPPVGQATPPQTTAPVPTPPPTLPAPPKVTMTRGSGEEVLFTTPAKELKVRLEFSSGERLWMLATVDDRVAFEGYPVEGGVSKGPMEFKGSSIRLRMGHMNGVSVVVNDQRFDQPLQKGPFTLILKGQ